MSTPSLAALTEASERATALKRRRDAAKQERDQEIKRANGRGARPIDLMEAGRLSRRSVAYLVSDVKVTPVMGESPGLDAVERAAEKLEGAQRALDDALEARNELITAAMRAKAFTVAQLHEATGVRRSQLYKIREKASAE